MRVTRMVSDLSGVNESPIGGDFIIDEGRSFVSQNVVTGISILYNQSKGLNAIVTNVTETRIDATGTNFSPGDFYIVSLATDWLVQNSDGPIYEVQCRVCGFSYPEKDMLNEVCKWCQDSPPPGI